MDIVKFHALESSHWSYAAAESGILNTVTAVTIAPAATGLRNCITGMQLATDGALGAATELAIRDGAGGAVLFRIKIPTAGIAPINLIFNIPVKGTAGNLLEVVTLTASVTGSVYVNVQGYTGG